MGALLAASCADKSGPAEPSGNGAKIPFDAAVDGLPDAEAMRTIEARNGDTVRLKAEFVAKWVAGRKVRMLGYNRSIPGPLLKVPQGAEITLILENGTDQPTTLHSHGVRLEYRSDGVAGTSAQAVAPGKSFAYRIRFPDPGLFWYHPHWREDYQMELGLYGGYLVTPRDSGYWAPVHRESVLFLDDLSIRGNAIQAFYKDRPDHTMMGRFGNVFLVNGDTAFTMRVKRNEAIRFYVVNAANSRVFNLQYSRDMDLNIVGADNGRFEFPSSRENYLVPPSERTVFQLLFNDGLDDYDTLELWNSTPAGVAVLARFVYDADTAKPDLASSINLRQSPHAAASLDPFRPYFDKQPDEEILLTGWMDMSGHLAKATAAQHDPDPGNTMGVEWSDSVHGETMRLMNAHSDTRNMHWAIRDLRTGKENHEINWSFKRGSKPLIRVRNDTTLASSDPKVMNHPMPHPIHFHGQRFLVVRENGKAPLEGLAWRDSYLIGRGYTVDLLLDADNPGEWMFHCHIAEHLEDDMMAHFRVVDSVAGERTPFPWSLGLAGLADSIRRDTALAGEIPISLAGTIHAAPGAPAAISAGLDGKIRFRNADDAALSAEAAFDARGNFSLPIASLFGTAQVARLKVFTEGAAGYRPAPDTLRITLDRRARLSWSLDLDLAGDTALSAFRREASAVSRMQGQVAGKVNGYDPEAMRDTLYFRNMIYPELLADAPISAAGAFSFDAADIVGSLDGLHDLKIFLKPVPGGRRPDPDTLVLHLSVP